MPVSPSLKNDSKLKIIWRSVESNSCPLVWMPKFMISSTHKGWFSRSLSMTDFLKYGFCNYELMNSWTFSINHSDIRILWGAVKCRSEQCKLVKNYWDISKLKAVTYGDGPEMKRDAWVKVVFLLIFLLRKKTTFSQASLFIFGLLSYITVLVTTKYYM